MARQLGFVALVILATSTASARGQFLGGMGMGGMGYGGMGGMGYGGMVYGGGGFGGYGYGGPFVGNGFGFGYPGFGVPFAAFPYPVATGNGNFYTGPGSFNPFFGMGLTPLGVDSFLGEMSLRRPPAARPTAVSPQQGTTVTVPGSGSRTYTYRIYRQ